MHANSSRSNSLRSIFCAQIRWLLASIPILRMKQIGRLSQILKSVIIREHRATWTPTVFTYFSGLLMAVFLSAKWPSLVVNYVIYRRSLASILWLFRIQTELLSQTWMFVLLKGQGTRTGILALWFLSRLLLYTQRHTMDWRLTQSRLLGLFQQNHRERLVSVSFWHLAKYISDVEVTPAASKAWLSIELKIPTGFLQSEN